MDIEEELCNMAADTIDVTKSEKQRADARKYFDGVVECANRLKEKLDAEDLFLQIDFFCDSYLKKLE